MLPWGLWIPSCSLYEVSDVGMLAETLLICLTDMSISDCLHLLLDLVVALAKSPLVLVFSIEDTFHLSLFSFMTALFWEPSPDDHLWHLLHQSWAYSLFSWVRKPVLDTLYWYLGFQAMHICGVCIIIQRNQNSMMKGYKSSGQWTLDLYMNCLHLRHPRRGQLYWMPMECNWNRQVGGSQVTWSPTEWSIAWRVTG